VVDSCNEYLLKLPIVISNFENQPFYFKQRELGGKNLIYRARKIDNTSNIPYPKVADIDCISESKKGLISSYGRVNKPEERMFYGATSYSTACFETLSKGKDFQKLASAMTTTGCWIVEEPINIVEIPYSRKYSEKLTSISKNPSVKISNDLLIKQEKHFKKLLENDLDYEKMILFSDSYANFEIDSENDYYLSNYYKDRIFNKIKGFKVQKTFDAIQYPSVPFSFELNNIVIRPEVAEKKLRFFDAMQVWVLFNKEKMSDVQFIPIEQNVMSDDEGILKWR